MVKHNLTGVPIVKKTDGSLAGMITRSDIFSHPEEDQLAMVMGRDPLTLSPRDSVEHAASLIVKTKVTHYPVVEDGRLVGILTPTDLLYEVEKKASGIPVEELALSPWIIECAFSNQEQGLAEMSKHYCPALLARELRKLNRRCEIHITHLKPGQVETTMAEIESCLGEFSPIMLQNNQLFDF